MRAWVRFQTADSSVRLSLGDLIGRLPSAAWVLHDPRISTAHALLVQRRQRLTLLALRGRVSLDGKPKTQIVLEPGQRLLFAGWLAVDVAEVFVPATLLALSCRRADGSVANVPLHQVITIGRDGAATPRFDPDGAAYLVSSEDGPRLFTPSFEGRSLAPGERFSVAAHDFELAALPTAALDDQQTADRGVFEMSLELRLYFDTVHVVADTGQVAVLDGAAARVVSELAEIGAPIAWNELAAVVWDRAVDPGARHRWDQLMVRLRTKLRQAGIRTDLVRATHGGLVELLLGPRDRIKASM